MDGINAARWFVIGTVVSVALFDLRTTAQETDAKCVLASLQWSFNSQKESPCEVASTLIGVCTGGGYNVVALPNTNSDYLGPTIDAANPCQCNTVVYSLMSACALCQNGSIITWSQWTTNCATIYDTFPKPIPDGLRVPAYAYLDVETQDIFDETAAMQDANATESTALPSSTTSKISSTQSSSRTSSSQPSASPTNSASDSLTAPDDPQSNAIGGGVVGGILGLAVLFLLIGLIVAFRRRRRSRNLRPLQGGSGDSEKGVLDSSQPISQGVLDISSTNAGSTSSVSEDQTEKTQQKQPAETPKAQLHNVPSIHVVSSSSDK
ncbi:hypothetical protein FB446DRAFT_407418 [Lentinula raphanica]|nr:hypothetical protein FB446DRAFT_407418 [Lentinula raphanica]